MHCFYGHGGLLLTICHLSHLSSDVRKKRWGAHSTLWETKTNRKALMESLNRFRKGRKEHENRNWRPFDVTTWFCQERKQKLGTALFASNVSNMDQVNKLQQGHSLPCAHSIKQCWLSLGKLESAKPCGKWTNKHICLLSHWYLPSNHELHYNHRHRFRLIVQFFIHLFRCIMGLPSYLLRLIKRSKHRTSRHCTTGPHKRSPLI